ncbi:hypothetical protein HBI56_020880 [Parastagonospora nodorum]|uniref:Uncharacterized protein n=1 Tax=Phaeosphaeria nodorum (strain SN15 / ATCC MYA-4574 / FGSC 10173) TaxID=321614 RepID=A0A7U2F0I0_PHANO|nr:hypothetical protein HBH56_173850 [Parastagonospora nodorum]QRC96392.1 hypothetical protein JI435_013130 [Parastagonospora nodorum SN15]KAH3926429.1 hypothetical protein HBH54_169250 [Parastagonospora nodorum]KAH3982210.1 hypothetical protein HBH52_074710 [Parastagonospora nodorum]KAH4007306.1 hypothetical protein HBI10_007870 [Parastagonospora nodorum]
MVSEEPWRVPEVLISRVCHAYIFLLLSFPTSECKIQVHRHHFIDVVLLLLEACWCGLHLISSISLSMRCYVLPSQSIPVILTFVSSFTLSSTVTLLCSLLPSNDVSSSSTFAVS